MESKVSALCQEFGPGPALAALRATEATGESKSWAFVIATARNMAREGGSISTSKPKASSLPTAPGPNPPIRTPQSVVDGQRDRWETWLRETDPAIRSAIEKAEPGDLKVIRGQIDRATNPTLCEDSVRARLVVMVPGPTSGSAPPTLPTEKGPLPDLDPDPEFDPTDLAWLDAV
jgi:hypothetical protein